MTPQQLRQALRDLPPESEAARQARVALISQGLPFVPAVQILSQEWEKRGNIVPMCDPEEWEEIFWYADPSPDEIPGFPGFEEYTRLFRMEWGGGFEYWIVASEIY